GRVLIASDADVATARKGYRGRLLGYLDFDRRGQAFTRFDLVAVGENWWNERVAYEMPLGALPMGVAFELAPRDSAFYHVPPAFFSLSGRDWKSMCQEYLGTDTEKR